MAVSEFVDDVRRIEEPGAWHIQGLQNICVDSFSEWLAHDLLCDDVAEE
jgi:hypothetical protein